MKQFAYLMCAILLLATQAIAEPMVSYEFDSAEREALFNKLSNELRCLVCQNQSIADSNAGLAKDLRSEIYEMIQAGNSEAEIIDFMVQRYGDYVLYRPPFKIQTVLLWLGPILVFIVGVVFAMRLIKSQSSNPEPAVMSDAEAERLKDLQAESRSKK